MRFFILLFLLISFQSFGSIHRENFYSVFETNSIEEVNKEIKILNLEKPSILRDAFLGAMIMKHAQFLKTPKEKINEFKKGKELLESAIRKQPENAEYRFLRLVIQENCPKVLKYNASINMDVKIVKEKYSKMNSITKNHVKKYAFHSKVLNF